MGEDAAGTGSVRRALAQPFRQPRGPIHPGTPLSYDFSGFHPRDKTLPYATPGATTLAQRLVRALPRRMAVHEFTDRGLDHGAFIPLMMARYPAADVPVVQLSMPSLDPGALLDLGSRLRSLREEGILLLGSGFMTHSFAAIRSPALVAHTAAFDTWAADALARGDVDALTDFRSQAPEPTSRTRPLTTTSPCCSPWVPPRNPAARSAPSTGWSWATRPGRCR